MSSRSLTRFALQFTRIHTIFRGVPNVDTLPENRPSSSYETHGEISITHEFYCDTVVTSSHDLSYTDDKTTPNMFNIVVEMWTVIVIGYLSWITNKYQWLDTTKTKSEIT